MTSHEALPPAPAASVPLPPPSPSQAAASPPLSSQQGGHVDGAQDDLARKMEEVDHLLAKLKNTGKEIDIEMARIRAEAMRTREALRDTSRRSNEKICLCSILPELLFNGFTVFTIASGFFYLGWRCYEEELRMQCGGFYGIASSLNRFFFGTRSL